ncbi:hypothetical protein BaRGS_00006407 [Batillaria attramentaria]|uniref:Uncharacterized protein n=1 Tax=Batillaria attramentaria TaxID=370345 RepID=A0ABD0LSC7_9CAEN
MVEVFTLCVNARYIISHYIADRAFVSLSEWPPTPNTQPAGNARHRSMRFADVRMVPAREVIPGRGVRAKGFLKQLNGASRQLKPD